MVDLVALKVMFNRYNTHFGFFYRAKVPCLQGVLSRQSIESKSDTERLRWFVDEKTRWGVDQLIHEFTGGNQDNWRLLLSSEDGKLLAELFDLLSLADLRENEGSGSLYHPFSTPGGFATILQYLEDEPICEASVETASEGRGSPAWSKCVKSASDLLQTLMTVLKLFGASVKTTLVNSVLTVMSPLIDTLAPVSDDCDDAEDSAVKVMAPWARSCRPEDRGAHCLTATTLRDLHRAVVNKLKVLKVTEKKRKATAEKKAELEARAKSDNRLNARQGSMFLNEVRHDRDYMDMSVVPSPEQMLSRPHPGCRRIS